jgi:hypothetical protein
VPNLQHLRKKRAGALISHFSPSNNALVFRILNSLT